MTEEPPIDIHHYTWAIRRALPKILVLALLAGFVAVLSTSLYTSRSFSASTTILAGNTLTPNQSPDATTLARSLATVNLLTGTTDVLALAASKLPNTTVDALRSAVQSTVNPEANVITIKATADTPEAAAARANAVARALIATERRIEQRATADKLRAALREVRRLRSAGATRTKVQAAENRISSLAANAVGSAGGFPGHPGSGAARRPLFATTGFQRNRGVRSRRRPWNAGRTRPRADRSPSLLGKGSGHGVLGACLDEHSSVQASQAEHSLISPAIASR